MYYYYYYYYGFNKKYDFKDYIFRIEEVNRNENTILIDFYDSFQYRKFLSILNLENEINSPSMILIKNINFQNTNLKEDSLYILNESFFLEYANQFSVQYESSFLIGYNIDFDNKPIRELLNRDSYIYYKERMKLSKVVSTNNDVTKLNFDFCTNNLLKVIIRNVGQANWNEIYEDNNVKIIYDVGAPMNDSRYNVRMKIANKPSEYNLNKPILFLSHWDKDHYHALLGMTDEELKCFSSFVCRNELPNITSQNLFERLCEVIGYNNVYSISYEPKRPGTPRGYKGLYPLTTGDLLLFNSEKSSDRNRSGIVLSLQSKKSSIVLSGDSHYKDISKYVLPSLDSLNQINHLIVPHHGGKGGRYEYLFLHTKKESAIISVGPNSYGHPNPGYVSSLNSEFKLVNSTENAGMDIEVNLI